MKVVNTAHTMAAARRFALVAAVMLLAPGLAPVAASQTFETLHSFDWPTAGYPTAGLIQAADGNFYGTTSWGGEKNAGTIFKMDAAGTVTVLHRFDGATGAYPRAGLIQAADGNFYGTTTGGGVTYNGTIFRMDAAGAVTVLHSFDGITGASPYAGLIQAVDGSLYGTTYVGGTNNNGTIFKMDAAGTVTVLHSFDEYSDGSRPAARLIQAADGTFYGTASEGGPNSWGTIFGMDASGTVTVLHSFDWITGAHPFGDLIQAADGNFYGTTENGGSFWGGTIFKMDAAGAVTVLHAFDWAAAGPTIAGLIQAADGSFYGTTYGITGTPWESFGSVFKMDAAKTFTVLHSFDGTTGSYPQAGLIEAADGSFYGTTYQGGAGNFGTIYRLVTDSQPPEIRITTPADRAAFELGAVVAADYSCSDPSGVSSCAGTVPNGASLDTATVGPRTFTVMATDTHGNTGTLTHSYSVIYPFAGFFRPVDNQPTLNSVKAGRAIPVKFSLGGDRGLAIMAAGSPVSRGITCDAGAPIDSVEATSSAGQSSLTYDAAAGQYVYVWNTDSAWANTCRRLIVTLVDGTNHTADFRFTR